MNAPMQKSITVKKLTPALGAEIGGIDLSRPLSAQQVNEVQDALAENLVIVFRDQELSVDQHKAFGRLFGELHIHPAATNTVPGHPEVLLIRADENSQRADGEEWHSDCLLYTSPSPRDGLLSRMPSSA